VTLLLRLLRLPLPVPVKRRALAGLFSATADAFDTSPPDLRGLPFEERLRRYALFTRDEAERCLRDGGNVDDVQSRLHENARRLGARLRRSLGLSGIEEALAAGRALYRIVEIDLEPGGEGAITIRRCYFADFYSGDVCRLISAVDEGVFDGLSGGGRLSFHERMTEGCDACRARLVATGAPR
jgi:hypothetical protein